jgi:hypothetical protein
MSYIMRKLLVSTLIVLLVATSTAVSANATCSVVGWHDEAEGMYPIFRCG